MKQNEEFNVGSKVYIKSDISTTDRLYYANRTMKQMAGDKKLYQIQGSEKMSTGKVALIIKTYKWDSGDVYMPDIYEKREEDNITFIFDVNQLCIEDDNFLRSSENKE